MPFSFFACRAHGWSREAVSPALAIIAAALLALPLAGLGTSAIAAETPWKLIPEPRKQVDVLYKGRRVMLYVFATNQFKPYVKELYTLQGENILQDAPPDHLHHHGLMYAIRVNGVNFWEEREQPGWEVPVSEPECAVTTVGAPGNPGPNANASASQVTLSQAIHWVSSSNRWVAATAPVALLVERRTLTLMVDEAQGEVALIWESRFQAGQGAPQVTLAGANYHGLGLRLPKAFDHAATHRNSARLPYSAEQRGDVTPADWSTVSHQVNGHDVTVTLFNRPANPGQCKFFTMLDAFAYLSATQGLDKAPREYRTGQQFALSYLLTIHSSQQGREFIEDRYRRWSETK